MKQGLAVKGHVIHKKIVTINLQKYNSNIKEGRLLPCTFRFIFLMYESVYI